MELKDCCMTVIKDNMELIETNKDGSRKSKSISPVDFAKESYRIFSNLHKDKKQYLKSLAGSNDETQRPQQYYPIQLFTIYPVGSILDSVHPFLFPLSFV